MPIAAIVYTLHLLSFPTGWSTPEFDATVLGRPTEATIGANGAIAVILASRSPFYEDPKRKLRPILYPPQRIWIVRSNGTTTELHAFDALETQPFDRHINPADCRNDTRSCPYFANVALAADGTPFVTLAQSFSGAYSGVREAALVWNGSWHVVPQGRPFDGTGDPYTPTNVSIAAADSLDDFAFNGDFRDGFGVDTDIHRNGYFRDIGAVHFGSRTIQLGLGTVTATRGSYAAGADAGLGLEGQASFPTTALLWQCVKSVAALHPCVRMELGQGIAYGVDALGEVVGDDVARYDGMAFARRPPLGFPIIWRNDKKIRLSGNFGAAYAISENGTIVGAFGAPGSGYLGFVAYARDEHPTAVALDPLVRDLGDRHVVTAFGVADDGRILVMVAPNGARYREGELAVLIPRNAAGAE